MTKDSEELTHLTVNSEVILYSFPKCGRTWLRYQFSNLYGEVLAAEHIVNPEFRDRHTLVLIRDPRDVMVSYFYEVSKRAGFTTYDAGLVKPWEDSKKTLSDFIRIGSFEYFFSFYKECIVLPEPKLILRYEDLHDDSVEQLQRMNDFLETTSLSPISSFNTAAKEASFNKMRNLEATNRGLPGIYCQGTWLPNLKPKDVNDLDSYKTRVGKVGEFPKYFSDEDMHFLSKELRKHEDILEYYGYNLD